MATVAKIFATRSSPGTSAVYTVPAGKHAVLYCFCRGPDTSNGIVINGVDIPLGFANLTGLVVPAGTTIAARIDSGGPCVISGFEYDDTPGQVARIFALQSGPGTSATYTVPSPSGGDPGRHAVVTAWSAGGNASNGLVLNGADFPFVGQLSGLVVPSGGTLAAKVVTGSPVIVTGFEITN